MPRYVNYSNPPSPNDDLPSSTNVWLHNRTVTRPSSSSTHDPHNPITWQLPEGKHGLSVIRATTLAAVQWGSPLFQSTSELSDPLTNCTVLDRFRSIVDRGNRHLHERLQATRLGSAMEQLALYLDSWNDEIHARPNLEDYEVFGLVTSARPSTNATSQSQSRKQLIHIAATAKALDSMLEAELFFMEKAASISLIASQTQKYTSSLEWLYPRTNHIVYQSTSMLPERSAARVCRSTLNWRSRFKDTFTESSPPPTATQYPAFSAIPNKLLASMAIKDGKSGQLTIELNIKRACFTLLTLWGLLDVSACFCSSLKIASDLSF